MARRRNADLGRAGPRIDALIFELVQDRQHVGRCRHHDVGLEVADQLHLPVREAGGDRHHGQAEPFGAVMAAEAAGEQA